MCHSILSLISVLSLVRGEHYPGLWLAPQLIDNWQTGLLSCRQSNSLVSISVSAFSHHHVYCWLIPLPCCPEIIRESGSGNRMEAECKHCKYLKLFLCSIPLLHFLTTLFCVNSWLIIVINVRLDRLQLQLLSLAQPGAQEVALSMCLSVTLRNSSLNLHSIFTQSSLNLHSIFTQSSLNLYSIFTQS